MPDPITTAEEALFVADQLDQYLDKRVKDRQQAGKPAPIIPADLGPYLRGTSPKSEAVKTALGQDLTLRRFYAGLLKGQSRWAVPRLAAADSGNITTREGDNLRISMTPSKRDEQQIYLRLTVTSMDQEAVNGTARLTVIAGNGDIIEEVIDDIVDGDVQILLGSDHPLIKALAQADSEFYLTPLT